MAVYTQNFTGVSNGNLSGVANWSTYQMSGSGVMAIDDSHNASYAPVVDFSDVGEQLAVYSQALSSAHAYCECDVMPDGPTSSSNALGPFLRGDAGTASSTSDGYAWVLEHGTSGVAYARLYRITNGAATSLFQSANLNSTYPWGEELVRRLRLEANNNWLLCYINGNLIHARDISGDSPAYTTGVYAGVYGWRGQALTSSQPWWDNWEAGDLPIILVGVTTITGSDRTSTTVSKPTGTAQGDLILPFVTEYNAPYDFAVPSGFTSVVYVKDRAGVDPVTHSLAVRKFAGASEPSTYTFAHGGNVYTYTHGGCMTLRVNTAAGFSWPTNPIESVADCEWVDDLGKTGNMLQRGATTTAVMAFGVGLASGYDLFTPGNNTVPQWTRLAGNDSNWLGVFIRQFDAATTYADQSHGEGEDTGSWGAATTTTIVVYAEAGGGNDKTATGSTSLTLAASGTVTAKTASSTGTSQLALAASGTAAEASTTTGATGIALAASGTAVKAGAATGATSLTLAASGTATQSETKSSTGTTALTLSADGDTAKAGAAASTTSLTFAASGSSVKAGAAASTTSLTFAASGSSVKAGAAASTTSLTFAASGAAEANATATVPDAITDLLAVAGDTQVVLTWTAPDDGGAAITDYIVEYRAVA